MAYYLYNGIKLPDIDTVWTDKETYKKATIILYNSTPFYRLILSANGVETGEGLSGKYHAPCIVYSVNAETGTEWKLIEELSEGFYSHSYAQIKWATYNVYYHDTGELFLAASEPVPVLSIDYTAMVQGWIVGKRLAAMRKRELVAYLYNGVRLPALPEWDTAIYPHAYIARNTNADSYEYGLVLKSNPANVHSGGLYHFATDILYKCIDGTWTLNTTVLWGLSGVVVWSNSDVYYNTYDSLGDLAGTLYLAASEPVPVYE